MKNVSRSYWALLAVTVGVYCTMVLWTLPAIQIEAGGLRPFDMRPLGYTFDEAKAFLVALSDDGRAIYGGPQSILDALYPPLLFATLGIAIWHVSGDIRKPTRIGMIAVAAIGMIADGLENVAVRDMLVAGGEGVTPELVARASFFTVTKSAATTVAAVALVILLVRKARAKKRHGGET
jgi:hypothetical protein